MILSEDHRLPLVAVNLWYHVGPANEEPGRTGFAHLFEHMMFQGSKHVPADQHIKLLEGAGASDSEWHHRFRSHELLRDRARESTRARVVARVGSHGYLLEQVTAAASPISRMSFATSGVRASRTSPTASSTKPASTRSFQRAIRTMRA